MKYEVKVSDKSIYIGDTPLTAIAAIDYYINREGIIVATHTEVDPDYRNQGLAGIVFAELIALAKAKDTKINPFCSYISEQLKRPKFNVYLYKKEYKR